MHVHENAPQRSLQTLFLSLVYRVGRFCETGFSFAAARRGALLIFLACGLGGPLCTAQASGAAHVEIVDATSSIPASAAADYHGGSSRTPSGESIGITERYLTRDGRPWIPVMGELHYSRVPAGEWESDILKMKAAGVTVISTYVFWIHHEEAEGQWDWSGRRDLRAFAQLCARHGMLLWVRIGPWAHGESRNGGLPDWVVKKGPTRQLDPLFMAETKTLYEQIGAQLRGLLWKDGGPVIGIQLENEYVARGAGKGDDYILALKRLAVASGLDVPLYSVTGWGNAVAPPHEVLPVYGGYPDAPWGDAKTELPPQEVYAFRFGSRVSGNMGMIGAAAGAPSQISSGTAAALPFLTAEMGGGIQSTYHRRPAVSANDIAAMMPVMLGSGVNGYGSYMFAGGINPAGKLTTLQESQATGYPTDVPVKDYGFQAPIGAFGLERVSLRLEKEWNYFLNDFGALLAPMPAFAPTIVPSSPSDESVLRWSTRTNGAGGFVFVNNYVRQHPMPGFSRVQFQVNLSGRHGIRFPDQPVDIPSGAYFAWPFDLDLDGIALRYGTAQLMARLPGENGSDATFVFFCVAGIRCELSFASGTKVDAGTDFRVRRSASETLVTALFVTQGRFARMSARTGGKRLQVVVLSSSQALDTWRLNMPRGAGLLETAADVFLARDRCVLEQLGDARFRFALYPEPARWPVTAARMTKTQNGQYIAALPPVQIKVSAQPLRAAAPVRLGLRPTFRAAVAGAPDDAEWAAAGRAGPCR